MGERKYCCCGWSDAKRERVPDPNCPIHEGD
jgi:hypothetical protein